MKALILICSFSIFTLLCFAKQPFERYQTILDRQMFGPLPEGFDPNASPADVKKLSSQDQRELSKEEEKLKSAIHFSVIDVTSSGEVRVGFSDNTDPKQPKNYFLAVDQEQDGWMVKAADKDKSTMTIVKNGIEVSLSLGGDSAKGAGTTTAASGGILGRNKPSTEGLSLRDRRMQRRKEQEAREQAQKAEAAEKEAEQQARAEEEKQRRDADLANQRQQLLEIQEELKRVREAKEAANKKSEDAHAEDVSE